MSKLSPPEIKFTKLFINNEFVDAVDGDTFPTINPCNGEKICDVAHGKKEDVDKAVAAARKAFELGSEWRTMDASARGALMYKLADLMEKNRDELLALTILDNGKPLSQATVDVDFSIRVMRYFAGWADKIHGNTIPCDGNLMAMTRKEPVGVVGQIIPWNFPVLMLAWKWAPALATGCCVVMKPAEQTPLPCLYMAHLAKEIGFPAGVLNVVTGYGKTAGAAVAEHMDIDKVAFTGSTVTGKLIMQAAGRSNLKRVSLELGGKSPLIIMDDADLDLATDIAYHGVFDNHGQSCCAASRAFVHEKVYDNFVQLAKKRALERLVGDPWDTSMEQGPQIDDRQFDKILDLIESGKKEGATVECGGGRLGDKGYFVMPTVFSGVEDHMRIAKEEIFGPVQQILKFKTVEEALERANKTTYGLAAGIITKDINKALMFAQGVQAGTVWVNCYQAVTAQNPFGGFKQSGQGRELSEDGLDEYLETKCISIQIPQKNS